MLEVSATNETELTMSNKRQRLGFSLLELMIVLVIMAAATAVVWPNLQKPLRRTSLTESASLVRELLDEARNQASSRGSAYFARLETGNGRIYFGTLQQFLEDGSLINDVAGAPSRSGAPQLRELADTVVVSNVRNSIAHRATQTLNSTSSDVMNRNGFQDQTADLPVEPSIPGADPLIDQSSSSVAGMDSQVFWLPMLASELGRDVSITLYDTQLQDSIEVTYCAATGAIEILP